MGELFQNYETSVTAKGVVTILYFLISYLFVSRSASKSETSEVDAFMKYLSPYFATMGALLISRSYGQNLVAVNGRFAASLGVLMGIAFAVQYFSNMKRKNKDYSSSIMATMKDSGWTTQHDIATYSSLAILIVAFFLTRFF